jgi:hypothetical protein
MPYRRRLILRSPEGVREQIARRYRNSRGEWLLGGGSWPIGISLGCPSEDEANRNIDAVREWITGWQSWSGPGELEWTERRWRSLGTQPVPERILIHTPMEAAVWIGERERWCAAQSRCTAMLERRPLLAPKLARYFDVLADAPADEIARIQSVLDWLESNPVRSLYPRQLPIAGLDTKWIESRGGMVSDLSGDPLDFRKPPVVARLRVLDPALSRAVGGLSDIGAPVGELATLAIQPSRVWIVENFQTGLAFEPLRGSVVLMGLGYGVSVVSSIPWVRRAECFYWGDIDTHGFAMLSRARSVLPNLRSALMDEETLFRFRDLWGVEPVRCRSADATELTREEMDLFLALQRNTWAPGVRLEQERIAWDYAWSRIGAL